MATLSELHELGGQSPWLDNLRRDWIKNGELARWVHDGIRGVTSNPTIFQRAMTSSDAYHEQLRTLVADGVDLEDSYWRLVISDIVDAASVLAPVYENSNGEDGYVSVEVSPELANDTQATIDAARKLHAQINQPNVMIKVPATAEGIPAIETLTAEGINVNITLIFSLARYGEVMAAYLNGLEAATGDLSKIRSVASFFVSRVDTEVDARLAQIAPPDTELYGQAAVAQAKLAYGLFQQAFDTSRWQALAARGANKQRPLWASTSTKNPAYADTLYVDALIGPESVNTLPESTIAAFLDHGTIARTIDTDLAAAENTFEKLEALGISFADVANKLEIDGVDSFKKSFNDVLDTLQGVRQSFL